MIQYCETAQDFLRNSSAFFWKNKKIFFLFGLVLGVGFFARFWELAWHFTNTDDLLVLQGVLDARTNHDILHLSKVLTNAPFEYLFTYFLISPDATYRDLLFWGRLPSCVAGCLALLALLAFYFVYDKKVWHKGFFSMVLVACSWENIAFAKQTHSYAIGVLAAVILILLFMIMIQKKTFDVAQAMTTGFVLALASSMQYQILQFIPAFYGSLFVFYFSNSDQRVLLIKNMILSAACYMLLIFPMWYFLLKPHFQIFTQNHLAWAGEYQWNVAHGFLKNIVHLIQFGGSHLYGIFESKIGFFPEAHPFFKFISMGLYLLFLSGALGFMIHRDKKTRALGLFFGLSLLTWWVLIPLKGLPYGTSRHTLILLPFFAVTAAEGLDGLSYLLSRCAGKEIPCFWQRLIMTGIGLFVLGVFLVYYGQFLKERRDPLVEKEVCDVFEAYSPDVVFYDRLSYRLDLMKRYRHWWEKIKKELKEARTIALLTRYPYRSVYEICEYFRKFFNGASEQLTGGKDANISLPCSDFQVVYEKKFESDATETFSRKTQGAVFTNRYYFYILTVDPEKKKLAARFNGKS